MRFSVDMTFVPMRSLGLFEPVFCVEVLSLYITISTYEKNATS